MTTLLGDYSYLPSGIHLGYLGEKSIRRRDTGAGIRSFTGNQTFYIQGSQYDDVLDARVGGAGNDSLYGNGGNDLLIGGAGYNYLDGGAGQDTLISNEGSVVGGTDIDTLIADYSQSSYGGVHLGYLGQKNIRRRDTGEIVLSHDVEVFNVTGTQYNDVFEGGSYGDVFIGGGSNDYLSGKGGNDQLYGETGNDSLYGGEGNDLLKGGDGNDTLDGGTGQDQMFGGTGDDAYTVDNANDIVTEAANQGYDTVSSSVNHTLGNNLEDLFLTGSAVSGTGNALNNRLFGNIANNILKGGGGNDFLSGGQGGNYYSNQGNDALYGENGDDQLFGASGLDTLDGGDGNDYLWGGDGNDYLWGGDGNDTLDGGTGQDQMFGGTGDDAYTVDNANDIVTDAVNQGYDTVSSSVNHTLGNNLEDLFLTGSAVSGTGNALNNRLFGNIANNILDGRAGNDYLWGGFGNDLLKGGDGNDTLDGDSGNDSLNGGAGDDSLYGGEGNDLLDGGKGNDFLTGGGSSRGEIDTLTGGAGADTFSLVNKLGNPGYANDDVNDYALITDFSLAQGDKIQLDGYSSYYQLVSSSLGNVGGSAQDTAIVYIGSEQDKYDVVGILQDVSLQSNQLQNSAVFTFV